MSNSLVNALYLLAAVLFIIGLKRLARPKTAVQGNLLGSVGMLIAILVTVFNRSIVSMEIILAGIVVGSLGGALLARKIQMTAMPQMVALLNGFGGIASTLVAGAALIEEIGLRSDPSPEFLIATAASALIGSVTFSGSLIAFGKLQGLVTTNPVLFPGRYVVTGGLGIVALVLSGMLFADPDATATYWLVCGVALVLGVLLVLPIGGADMPVVISLLNSYSGLAAAATGFVLLNGVLIISGALVGAAGLILTATMCKAMNRSLVNVLLGGFGATATASGGDDVYEGKVRSASPEDVALLLDGARRVVFVPGYGMAVAQAQHPVRTLATLLEAEGCEVEYAIHPVAGRMPGHMNVLLAEADVPYEQLKDMDEINPTFPETDVAIVIGANDVVNPLARTDPGSPIAGMPILNVDMAKTVIVIKRSLSPGFAGIPNPLFANENTLMLFADAKKGVNDIVAALKEALVA